MVIIIILLAVFWACSIANWVELSLLGYKCDNKLSLCVVQTISLTICVLKCFSLIVKKVIGAKGYFIGFMYAPLILYKIVLLVPLVNYECLSMICRRKKIYRMTIHKATENATEQMINAYAY